MVSPFPEEHSNPFNPFLSFLSRWIDTAWRTWHRVFYGPWESCTICDESFWTEDLIKCNSKGHESRHQYCPGCLEQTTNAMLTGDVAFLYDPVTTLPLCCYCPPSTSSTISIHAHLSSLSPALLKSWEQRIVSIQLRGLPLITCAHCGYIVIDEEAEEAQRRPELQTSRTSFRRRIATTLSTYILPAKAPKRFTCPECNYFTCRGCSAAFNNQEPHECRTDDLRLQIEQALDKRLVYACPECTRSIVKEGGCNHCTCLCGAEYCHICHKKLRTENAWRSHFCGHFIADGAGACTQCSRCPLYGERDDEAIRRDVENEVRDAWRRKKFWGDIKSLFGMGR